MRGCETCSGLVYVGDAFCPTCGAEVGKVRTRADQVTIPMRRHGHVPSLRSPLAGAVEAPDAPEDRRLPAVLLVLFAMIAAGWVGAALYWIG